MNLGAVFYVIGRLCVVLAGLLAVPWAVCFFYGGMGTDVAHALAVSAAVSLGLLHGSQPDAIVVCHRAGCDLLDGLEVEIEIPPLNEVAEAALNLVQVSNPNCQWRSPKIYRLLARSRSISKVKSMVCFKQRSRLIRVLPRLVTKSSISCPPDIS